MRMRTVFVSALGLAASLVMVRPASAARFSPHLASIEVGGGVTDFTRSEYRERTSVGGAWDARLTIGTRTPLALELGYVGSAQGLHDPFGGNATLASESAEGLARINLTPWRFQPFIVGGVGYINYHTFTNNSTGAVAADTVWNHNTNGVDVPMGGGIATYIGKHGVVDGRFMYRLVPEKDVTPDLTMRPDNWTAMIRGGYAF